MKKRKLVCIIFCIILTTIFMVTLAQEAKADILKYEFNHTMLINGQKEVARGLGELHFDEGYFDLEVEISNYIQGYALYASSVVTSAGGGGTGGDIAVVAAGAVDIRSLMENGFTYTARAFTQDAYADIVTDIEVTQEGDLVVANLISRGQANYPLLIGMEGPVDITQIPTSDGFTEVGTKRLVTEAGEIILSSMYVEYKGIALTQPQHRQLSVEMLDKSEDARHLKLRYNGTITPLDGTTVEYTNEMSINGDSAVATAQGFVDRLSGIIVVDATIDRYIDGYRPWCISPVTTIVQTLAPAFSLEFNGASNLQQYGNYESSISWHDKFANLDITATVDVGDDRASAKLVTTGEAAYPELSCPSRMRMLFTQTPTVDGMLEVGYKLLTSVEGDRFEIPAIAAYRGAGVDQEQERLVEVIATDISEDMLSLRLIYRSVVSTKEQ